MRGIIREIKIIWNYLGQYKKRVYSASILALISILISAVIPYFYGKLVDLVFRPDATSLILNILIIWLLMSIVSAVLKRISRLSGSLLGVDIFNNFILKAASHLINLPLSFHKEKKTGEIFSKIDRAADSLVRITDDILIWFFPSFVSAILGILFLFFIERQLAIAVSFLFFGYILINCAKLSLPQGDEALLHLQYSPCFAGLAYCLGSETYDTLVRFVK